MERDLEWESGGLITSCWVFKIIFLKKLILPIMNHLVDSGFVLVGEGIQPHSIPAVLINDGRRKPAFLEDFAGL